MTVGFLPELNLHHVEGCKGLDFVPLLLQPQDVGGKLLLLVLKDVVLQVLIKWLKVRIDVYTDIKNRQPRRRYVL